MYYAEMQIFYTRTEEGDKVVYAPIGKRAALLAIAWIAMLSAAVWFYQDNPLDVYRYSFLLASSVGLVYLPNFVTWVDGLPDWFPPSSSSRDGGAIFILSWTGKRTVISKKEEARYMALRGRSVWMKFLLGVYMVALGYLMWYFWIRRP